MNKHLTRVLIGVIIAVLTMTMCLAGCGNTDELQTQIDDLKTLVEKAQTTADDAVKAAGDKSSTVKADLEAAINALKEATAAKADLDAAVAKIDAAATKADLDAAKKASEDADKAIKESLEAIKATVKDLDVAELNGAIADLEEAVNGAVNSESYETATDAIVEYLGKLAELNAAWDAAKANYTDATQAEVVVVLNEANIRILRATSVEELEAIIENVETTIDEAPDKADEVKAILVDKIGGLDGVKPTEACKTDLNAAKAIIDNIIASGDAAMKNKLNTYGKNPADATSTGTDLEALYAEMLAKWNRLFAEEGAAAVKKAMDAVIAKPATLALKVEVYGDAAATPPTTGVEGLFTEWKNVLTTYGFTYADEVAKIKDFDKTIEAYEALKARLTVLDNAKAAAATINTAIEDLEVAGTVATQTALKNLADQITAWCTTYAIPAKAADGVVFIQDNYDLVDHKGLKAKQDQFDILLKQYKDTAKKFVDAVKAIDDPLTKSSNGKIDAAFDAYYAWTALNKVLDLELLLDENEKPTEYYEILVAKKLAHNKLLADIKTIEDAIKGELKTDLGTEVKMPYFDGDATKRDAYKAKCDAVDALLAQFLDKDGKLVADTVDATLVETFEGYKFLIVKDKAYADLKATLDTYKAKAEATDAIDALLDVAFEAQVKAVDAIDLDDTFGADNDVTADKEIERLVGVFAAQLQGIIDENTTVTP